MRSILLFSILFSCATVFSQEKTLYDVNANAKNDIEAAVKKAESSGKHVLIQAGGNWCSWCIKFDKYVKADAQIDSILKASYEVVHLNYSKENKNEKVFAQLGYPQRFGFPSFIILDGKGTRLHTQNSEYLEDGKGSYEKRKVFEFMRAWSPFALDPKTYEENTKK